MRRSLKFEIRSPKPEGIWESGIQEVPSCLAELQIQFALRLYAFAPLR